MCPAVVTVERVTRDTVRRLPHQEEPIDVIGRAIPMYDGSRWTLTEELYSVAASKTYPADDEESMRDWLADCTASPDRAAFIAMLDGQCVGEARVTRRWNRCAHIDNITVNRKHRGRGVGRGLMDAAVQWGKDNGLERVSVETQDWNLLAVRFYLKYGFRLGGIDRLVYDAFDTRGETALYFYLLAKGR